jgi:transposase
MNAPPPLPDDLWAKTPPDVRAAILALVQTFEQRVAALEARLNRNSSNSSKPPSAEPLHVKRRPPRPASRKRRGGQVGHERHTRELVPPKRLTSAIEIKPPTCTGCGHSLDGHDPEPIRHQVAELPEVRPEVIEYRLHRLTCPGCGVATRAKLPTDAPRGAFGPRLRAWAGLLSGAYRLSKRQVQRLFADLLGVPISTGMVAKLQREAGEILADPMAEIVEVVRQADAVHVDETGWREEGKKAWLWVGVTAGATAFLIRRSRGHDALEDLLGENPRRDQVIISDRFPTYTRAPNRQLCWAHLRRDFQAMIDRSSGGESVGRRLLDQSRWAFTWWRRFGEGSIARPTLRSYVAGLKGVVGLLLREGVSCACAWTAKVCRKILEAEKHLWRFAEVEGVAPDNNAAERALRHGAIWRKLSLGTASEAGSRFVERLLSVVETCRQRGRSAAAYLTACFIAKRTGQPIPSPLT